MPITQQEHSTQDKRHVWAFHLQGIDDPARDLKVQVHDGSLLVTVKGHVERLQLPVDAYTADAHARYQRGTLSIDIARKDPASPAMQEKAAMDPDRPHPRDVPLVLPPGAAAAVAPHKPDPTGRGAPTPAEVAAGEGREELHKQPRVRMPLPAVHAADVLPAAVPILAVPGGAVEAPDNGETVQVVQRRDAPEAATIKVPHAQAAMADQMSRLSVAPPGTEVIGRGGYADKGQPPSAAQAPAGPEDVGAEEGGEVQEEEWDYEYEEGEEEEGESGEAYDRKEVDYTEEKVGLKTRPYEPRDFYAHADSAANEPYTNINITDEVEGSMGTYPYNVTPQETKRRGKPSIHNVKKPTYRGHTTGNTSHTRRDYRIHAQPRPLHTTSAGNRMADFQGGVRVGEPGSRAPAMATEGPAHGPNTGGREIPADLVNDRTRTRDLAQHLMG